MADDPLNGSQGAPSSPEFREELPEHCPPNDAAEIVTEIVVFRLVAAQAPCDADFRSQRAEKPTATFNVDECRARGLSVFADRASAEKVTKFPTQKGKRVCQVTLTKGAGYIKQTGRPEHRTWWPYLSYDILSRCEVAL